MQSSINSRLLSRELDVGQPRLSPRGLYGHRNWVRDLDIVDELAGHTGCVNALSWSKSGQFLASGSDDTHLNIHKYLPSDSNSSFSLQTSISTGHTANIFSVKFMPHSGDRTLVSAAGDADIRVFDLEYAARNSSGPLSGASASRSTSKRPSGRAAQLLSEGDTNTKVYRSHTERVKRIVTESSPFLFLSCSEDGEVRQWDIRQPSSAYPRPRGGRGFRTTDEDETNVPPPLISYRKHNLDLHTISCSPSQPHYIALGGVHLHCFLHDRRMLGRDRTEERGSRPIRDKKSQNGRHDEFLDQATRCVRRFAPQGQRKMKRNNNGHITACKISDAQPNEMVVSWSSDHIYSFDLMRSPDARESVDGKRTKKHIRQSRARKRKRALVDRDEKVEVRPTQLSGESGPPTLQRTTLKVNYENGQTEKIPLISDNEADQRHGLSRDVSPSEQDQSSDSFAKTVVAIRQDIFACIGADIDNEEVQAKWSTVLNLAASILPDMDEVSRTWTYPVNPDAFELSIQTTLRLHRQRVRRFVQAAGTLARLLGSGLQSTIIDEASLSMFEQIEPAPRELQIEDTSEQFSYDFLKSIILWLLSGPSALVQGFSKSPLQPKNPRFPVSETSQIDEIDNVVLPYLRHLAGSRSIPNLEVSRFEVDENRTLVESETAATIAFARALKTPFADLSTDQPCAEDLSSTLPQPYQNRKAALQYWAVKVGRGVLLNAGSDINYALVDRAFGGFGRTPRKERLLEKSLDERISGISTSDNEVGIDSLGLETETKSQTSHEERLTNASTHSLPVNAHNTQSSEDYHNINRSDDDMVSVDDVRSAMNTRPEANADNSDIFEESGGDSSSLEDSEEEDDGIDDDDEELFQHAYIFRSALARSARRCRIHRDVPCFGSFRSYSGAANARTVKDVNFWGLNDEYVVAGSDDGNFFIWDKETTQRLNILEGDGEVVNVIQGHPYEPILAVSGIDSTVKIFSPDSNAQTRARMGVGVSNVDTSGFSSLHIGGRAHRRAHLSRQTASAEGSVEGIPSRRDLDHQAASKNDRESSDDEVTSPFGLSSRKRMKDEYAILSRNEDERRDGPREAFITRSMLAQIMGHARARTRAAAESNNEGEIDDGEDADDEEGIPLTIENGRIVIGDDCALM